MRILIGFAFAMLLIAGCTQSDTDNGKSSGTDRVSDDNVFSGQVRALEKAESLEIMIFDGAKARDAEIEQQTRQ